MKQKIFFVACILFGLLFVVFGLNKLLNFMPPPPDMPEASKAVMNSFMGIKWLMPLLGIAEMIAGVLIMIPKTRAIGALAIFPIMVGILLQHIVVDTSGLGMGVVLAAILGWIMYENKDKYLALLK